MEMKPKFMVCMHQFERVFKYFGLDIHKFTLCQTADDHTLSGKIAALLNIPELNLDVKKMFHLS